MKEYTDLKNRGTFKVVDETTFIKTVPIIWVFIYKIDTNRYLIKFKAQLYIRGNLQELIYKNTYAATLVAKVFRTFAAIIAAFNLDIW